jgi:hypothetical protein
LIFYKFLPNNICLRQNLYFLCRRKSQSAKFRQPE